MHGSTAHLLELIGIDLPIIQAPMAGVSTPALAAAVANIGALGSIGIGASNASGAASMIDALAASTNRAFNVNVFCHAPAQRDDGLEAAWLGRLTPLFAALRAAPPISLAEIYKSFVEDDAMLALLLERRPKVVSLHFGLPDRERLDALKAAGIVLLATATNLHEARAAERAGVDVVVAQGIEAGGHRGVFDPDGPDPGLSTHALVRLLLTELAIPVVAAGGIMDGADIRAYLDLGAAGAQLGTAFVPCPETSADAAYRAALAGEAAHHTTLTRALSGRPARSLATRFTDFGADVPARAIPAYPVAYDAAKALHAVAKVRGEFGYGAYWAGQGAPRARAMPAAALVDTLAHEAGLR